MKKIVFFSLLISSVLILTMCKSENNSTVEAVTVDEDMHQDTEGTASSDMEESDEHTIDHTVVVLNKQPFSVVIRTSGQIMTDSKDITIINARASGIIRLADHFLFPGVKVLAGQDLFTVSGGELAENNTEIEFEKVMSDLEKTRTNYERSQKLISDKIITEEKYLDAKNEYEKVLLEYNNLSSSFRVNGSVIESPAGGYLKEIFVSEGQKVTAGEAIASIVVDHKLVLKADVSPDYLNILPDIEQANFIVGYRSDVFKTAELNGRRISYSKSTGENSYYIPLYFSMDYTPDLVEGTFADVFLIGKVIEEAIVVPNTSIMEEYGKLYVYQLHDDGDYVKRYITTGYSDGESTQVLDGLEGDETIVATGTYQVKLSQMSATAPAHNH